MMRILLYDNQPLIRECIKSLFNDEPGIELIAEVGSNSELLDRLTMCKVDIVLLGVHEINDEELLLIRKVNEHTTAKLLLFSEDPNANKIVYAFDHGVNGYVCIDGDFSEFIFAINYVLKGLEYLSSTIGIKSLQDNKLNMMLYQELEDLNFTRREYEILNLIASGMTNQEIADKIFVSKPTVEGHRQNLIDKTKTRNTAHLVKYAMDLRLIS